MNKYSNVVTEINPMETAPVWDYYNGSVETITLFFKHPEDVSIVNVIGFYDREYKVWVDYYSGNEITEELVGWLPDYKYVSPN